MGKVHKEVQRDTKWGPCWMSFCGWAPRDTWRGSRDDWSRVTCKRCLAKSKPGKPGKKGGKRG